MPELGEDQDSLDYRLQSFRLSETPQLHITANSYILKVRGVTSRCTPVSECFNSRLSWLAARNRVPQSQPNLLISVYSIQTPSTIKFKLTRKVKHVEE
jgi:hypothetical protein